MPTAADKRRNRRYPLSLKIRARTKARSAPPIETTSANISVKGIYFRFPGKPSVGSQVVLELLLPPELGAGKSTWLRCKCKIVRVDRLEDKGMVGVAACIESYRFLRTA